MRYTTQNILRLFSKNQLTKASARRNLGRFEISGLQDSCAIGFNSSSGNPVLIIVVPALDTVIGRSTEGLVLSSYPDAEFRFRAKRWRSASVVLECRSVRALRTFSVLAAEIFELSSTSKLDAQRVVSIFDEWEALFGQVARMSQAEALGLWGEVWLLSLCQRPDSAISAWIANRVGRTDFLANAISFEVKTSRIQLTHYISEIQVQRPNGDGQAYFLSIWCEEDEAGTSLPTLVNDLCDRAVDTQMFERKLLARGYSHVHGDSYLARYRVLEEPKLFRCEDIPRVREFDEGIVDLRYRVQLKERLALPAAKTVELLKVGLGVDGDRWTTR